MAEVIDTVGKELFSQFDWFYQVFNNAAQASSDDFLYEGIRFKLYAVTKSLSTMEDDESYFVTKVKLDQQQEIYIRNSDKAVNTILTRALGPNKKFDINKITELEAKMVTAFNDNLYNFISNAFTPSAQQNRNFDMTHLTFLLCDDETKLYGKMIISFPGQIVLPQHIMSSEEKFSNDFFETSLIEVDLKIGSTTFTVGDLKALETEDIIVLDNSNIQEMRVNYKGYEKDFRITPNPALIISVDDSGGEEMSSDIQPNNLWDSIQVEMGAEFDKVKISLGELKNIEEGLVVDISSVYNSNVTLKVEEKVIASGELVIVNDRYGVKVNKIYAEEKQAPVPQDFGNEQIGIAPSEDYGEMMPQQMDTEPIGENMGGGNEGDFDYSDFDLEDEDL